MKRWAAAALLVVLGATASPATAAGTGGIEVTPIPGVVEGRQVTAYHVELPRKGDRTVEFALRNVTKAPRTARLYVAGATRGTSAFDVGAAGSTPYVRYPDQQLTLEPGELRRERFTLVAPEELPDSEVLAAVVVEVSTGSLVQRAATLIYLEPEKPWDVPVVALVAGALVILLGAAVISVRQRERIPPEFQA